MYKIPAGNEFSSCLVLGAGSAMQPSYWNLEVRDQSRSLSSLIDNIEEKKSRTKNICSRQNCRLKSMEDPANHLQGVEMINDKWLIERLAENSHQFPEDTDKWMMKYRDSTKKEAYSPQSMEKNLNLSWCSSWCHVNHIFN